MAYTPNVPLATESLGQTQSRINANFQGISTLVNVDHVDFDLANQGKHAQVTIPESATGPTTVANEGALYTKEIGSPLRSELFWRTEGDGVETQLTGPDFINDVDGTTYLPGGLMLKWGFVSAPGAGPGTVTYPLPAFSTVYSISVNALKNANVTTTVASITGGTAFEWRSNQSLGAGEGIYWTAIGSI